MPTALIETLSQMRISEIVYSPCSETGAKLIGPSGLVGAVSFSVPAIIEATGRPANPPIGPGTVTKPRGCHAASARLC